ncbi:MAG: peptidoglycan-binding protein [Alphaproteobacteria bacterium]|nr:peptidoglycan-binding protein [Alphaproteobacteria bacterium]
MRYFFFIIAAIVLCSCTQSSPQDVRVFMYGKTAGAGSTGVHYAENGDTIYKISQRYNLPMQDIIELNNFRPPYRLSYGQRILLPPPANYKIREGDDLRTIAQVFDTNVTDLARLNNLRPPYVIKTGQNLQIPSRNLSRLGFTTVKKQSAPATIPAVDQGTALPSRPAVVWQSLPTRLEEPQNELPQPVEIAEPLRKLPLDRPPARSGTKFMRPVHGDVISSYGPKKDTLQNDGINIRAVKGSPVRVSENGVVLYTGDKIQSYGNLVLVRHDEGWVTAYAHMDSILTEKGAAVTRGQTIGTVGSTGNVSTPQLHFELRKGSQTLNPESYLE